MKHSGSLRIPVKFKKALPFRVRASVIRLRKLFGPSKGDKCCKVILVFVLLIDVMNRLGIIVFAVPLDRFDRRCGCTIDRSYCSLSYLSSCPRNSMQPLVQLPICVVSFLFSLLVIIFEGEVKNCVKGRDDEKPECKSL